MRKFTTIFVAVVLCLAAFAVCASAASNTKCSDGKHDWSAWAAVEILEDGSVVMGRSCACGAEDEPYVIAAPHTHDLAHTAAVEGCHTAGIKEYWYCAGCDTHFSDAEAKYPVAYLSLATEPTVELGFVPATEACHKPGSKAYWQCPACDQVFADAEGTPNAIPTTRKDLETPADTELVHHEAIAPCHANGYLEYWYCPDCDGYFTDAAGTAITNIKNLTVEGDLSKLEHHEAVAPTATENGMQEYWYCAGCDCFFTDAEGKMNIAYLSLTIPATGEPGHVHNLEYTAAVPSCHNNGMAEYWYCAGCDCFFTDAEGKYNIAYLSLTTLGDLSKLEYHAAVAPTATENGMQEYWYCAGCDCFFTDAEGKYNIAYLSLTIPATGETPVVPNPSTGDNAIFFIVALVAVATLGVAAVSFKKREN